MPTQSLLSFDLDKYDLKWEISPYKAMAMLYGKDWTNQSKPLWNGSTLSEDSACSEDSASSEDSTSSPLLTSNITLLDLRSKRDFDDRHIRGSVSTPLRDLTPASESLFDDVEALHAQWVNMKAKFDGDDLPHGFDPVSGPMIVLCYNGETSRLATAVMRAKGWEAYSIKGGMSAIG